MALAYRSKIRITILISIAWEVWIRAELFLIVQCRLPTSSSSPSNLDSSEFSLFDTSGFDFDYEYSEPYSINYTSECDTFPKIVAFGFRGTEEITSEFSQDIYSLTCISQSPIELTYDGSYANSFISIERYREPVTSALVANPNDIQTCFALNVSFDVSTTPRGQFWCSTIDAKYKTGWYHPGNNAFGPVHSVLLNARQIEFNPRFWKNVTIDLPCKNAMPSFGTRVVMKDNKVLEIGHSIIYGSNGEQVGHVLNLSAITDPYGMYRCVINDPNETSLSPEAVDQEKNFVNVTLPPEFKVFSQNKTNEIALIGNEGIQFEETEGFFFCPSTMGACNLRLRCPEMTILRCEDQISCRLLENCFNREGQFQLQDKICQEANVKERPDSTCRKSMPYLGEIACVHVDNAGGAGLVHCLTFKNYDGFQTSSLHFFKGIDFKQDTSAVILDWMDEPKDRYLQVHLTGSTKVNRTFYDMEWLHLKCIYSKFLFVKGVQWRFEMENGSIGLPEKHETVIEFQDPVNLPGYFITHSKLFLHHKNIKSVSCFVALWNSTDWISESFPIHVNESSLPMLIYPAPNVTEISFSVGSTESIVCKAQGGPIPDITWSRDGDFYFNGTLNESITPNSNIKNSQLIFSRFIEDDAGNYECAILTREDGQIQTKTFVVSVYHLSKLRQVFALVGLTLFAGFLIVVISLLVWRLKEKQKLIKKFQDGDPEALINEPDTDGYIRAQHYPLDTKLEIKSEDLDFDGGRELGKGNFGIVIQGSLTQNGETKDVAVKIIKYPSHDRLKSAMEEYKVMQYVGTHENIVNLIGLEQGNIRNNDIKIVVEFCIHGSLDEYLEKNGATFKNHVVEDIRKNIVDEDIGSHYKRFYTMDTLELIRFSSNIAEGMEYLESKKIIHCDIAARNILISSGKVAKIADFGLSKRLEKTRYYISRTKQFPWAWASPEVLENAKFSTQSDIWAFGVTLWEIFSLGESPYQDLDECPPDFGIRLKQFPEYRLAQPAFATTRIYSVMSACWKSEELERINFGQLKSFFDNILNNLS